MAKIEYTIPEILGFAGIRGYSPRLASAINKLLTTQNDIQYQQALKTATQEIAGYELTNIHDRSDLEGYSTSSHFEGVPIYLPLILERVDGTQDDLLLDSAILEINRAKNVVVTQVQGRDTSIKEFINNGDFTITVSGLICERGVGYPTQQVKEFEQFMKAKVSIPVVHEVLNMLGVHEIVITGYAYPSSPFVNGQPYSFNALSEEPAELKLNF